MKPAPNAVSFKNPVEKEKLNIHNMDRVFLHANPDTVSDNLRRKLLKNPVWDFYSYRPTNF
ncbi:MAG TPA: hypothetical protein VF941_22035 [Clostridia bacterium]